MEICRTLEKTTFSKRISKEARFGITAGCCIIYCSA
jgi:hypothetical protein